MDFQPRPQRHSRVTGSRGPFQRHLRDEKGQRPTAELKPGVRPGEEVPGRQSESEEKERGEKWDENSGEFPENC